MEGSGKSQLVLHGMKPAKGLTEEAGLPLASPHSPASPNQTSTSSDHAPKIEGRDERRDHYKEGASTSKVEDGSGTGKTGHSTRTKRKHKTATRKRQHGEL